VSIDDAHLALVGLDDAAHDRQPEARAAIGTGGTVATIGAALLERLGPQAT
jgi:hypothetical protein